MAELIAAGIMLGAVVALIWGGYRAGKAVALRECNYTISTLRLAGKRYQLQAEQARAELAQLQRTMRHAQIADNTPGWLQ